MFLPHRPPAPPGAWLRAVGLACACGWLSGCYQGSAHTVSARQVVEHGTEVGWVLVSRVALVRQTADDDCGAAALAMMLGHWEVRASPADILRAVPRDPGHGIALGVLRDFARARGLTSYVIRGELADLATEVGLDHPVLVGLVQRYGDHARAHYEVVTGINPTMRRLLLLDPAHGLREDSFEGFTSEWTTAGRPTLVIVAAA
jgi:ABC-type bacteriocin/lantibiotic exporter with double-glycine peptidase domain